MKPRNYGEEAREYDTWMSDDNAGDAPEFRDQIDFSRYDGSRTSTDRLGKPGHDGDVNTSQLWDRVRKNIGIKDVDSENDLRQMFDYVTNYQSREDKPDAAAETEPESAPEPVVDPRTTDPNNLNPDQKEYQDTRLTNPGNQQPRYGFSDDPYKDAIGHGDDLNAHYANKFIPSVMADAKLTNREIGESSRFHIGNFAGKVPELGDPREMFEFYKDQLG